MHPIANSTAFHPAPAALQLEFGLRVHFAIWPLLDTAAPAVPQDVQPRLCAFQDYLAAHGADLAQQAGLASYYALPYVAPGNLREHPTFSHLFDPACTPAQRVQLEAYLQTVPASLNVPRLYTLWQNAAGGGGGAEAPAAADVERLLHGACGLDALLPDATPLPRAAGDGGASPAVVAQRAWDDAASQLRAIPESPQESAEFPAASPVASSPSPEPRPSAGSRPPTPLAAAMRAPSASSADGTAPQRASSSHSPQLAVSPQASELNFSAGAAARRSASNSSGSARVAASWGSPDACGDRGDDGGLGGSVTRSLVQQALLPVLDWRAVQRAILTRPPSDSARLLQARSFPCPHNRHTACALHACDSIEACRPSAGGSSARLRAWSVARYFTSSSPKTSSRCVAAARPSPSRSLRCATMQSRANSCALSARSRPTARDAGTSCSRARPFSGSSMTFLWPPRRPR